MPIGHDSDLLQCHQSLGDHLVQIRQECLDPVLGFDDSNYYGKVLLIIGDGAPG
jgi:hypothetical protein